jgi:hypothetical protein
MTDYDRYGDNIQMDFNYETEFTYNWNQWGTLWHSN